MTPEEKFTEALARLGITLKGTGGRCPAHDDHDPSMTVTVKPDGMVLAHCHAGCTTQAICDALGIPMSDLFPDNGDRSDPDRDRRIYGYVDEDGELRYQVVRQLLTGTFWQRRPDGAGGWIKDMKGVERLIYRLPEVVRTAEAGGLIFVVEGEKDVDRLRSLHMVATCCSGGAQKWEAAFGRYFDGADLVVLPDNDDAGRKYAKDVTDSLVGHAATVRVLELPGLDVKGDVSDWLNIHDDDIGGLLDLVEQVPEDSDDDMVPLINWAEVHNPADDVIEGIAMFGRWTQFVAGAKAGKSSLLMFMAIQLMLGRDPIDGTPRDPLRVLYCDGEMGKLDVEELIVACGHDPKQLNLPATSERTRLDTETGAARLLRRVDHERTRVLVLDGLNGFVDPQASENDNNTWRPFVRQTVDPLKQRGMVVLSADNMGKDPKLGSRGSSVKTDKADGVLAVGKTDNGVRLWVTHGRGGAYLANDLNLDAEGFDRSRPIRYWRAIGGWPAGTVDAAAMLDALGVPITDGRPKVRDRLKAETVAAEAAGLDASQFQVSTDVLRAAIRFRRPVLGGP